MTELAPATDLAAKAHRPYPGESAAYTKARTALLAEEVELRRHDRTRRRTAPCAARGAGSDEGLYASKARTARPPRRPVRGARHARHLLLDVRPRARAAVPDVHRIPRPARGQRARHPAEGRPRGDRALAGGADAGLCRRARLAQSAALQRYERGVRPRPQCVARRRRLAVLRRVHQGQGRHDPPFLERASWAARRTRDRTRAARPT